ncbi:MAG TPA: DedA family protein [Candidatus Limnocylindria bacterium]|nr:DedA family protein [Candidatus Limnocylindria bacterium]
MTRQNGRVLGALESIVIPFLDSLYSTIGYGGVIVAMTIESACIPLPSELILPMAGWAVARGLHEPFTGGAWDLWPAVIAGVIGNTTGSLVAYAVGAAGGRPLLERYGRYVLISRHDIELADRWFARYGDATVFFGRLLPVIRTFISLPAGIARMPLWRFLVFSMLGAIPWTIALVFAGKTLGENWHAVREALTGLDYVVVAAILVLIAVFVWRHIRT